MARHGRGLKGVLTLAAIAVVQFFPSRVQLVHGAVSDKEAARPSQDRDVANKPVRSRVQDGILVQEGCAQTISSDEAQARVDDEALPGGIITLNSLNKIGRSGNHFVTISAFFSMAFCCKSKMLLLPGQDNAFPTVDGRELDTPAETARWFDFSSNHTDSYGQPLPRLPEFEDLADRLDVCPPSRQFSGRDGFYLAGLHPDLARCINRVFVRGCEAEYLGSVVDDGFLSCPLPASPGRERTRTRRGLSDEESEDEAVAREQAEDGQKQQQQLHLEEDTGSATPELDLETVDDATAGLGLAPVENDHDGGGGGAAGARPLVIHVRSGDIFKPGSRPFPQYGQPPLHFYLSVLNSHNWSSVSIITSPGMGYLNPVFTALEELAAQGLLGPNVETFQERSFRTDLQAMLCAENLVLARSSLAFFLLGHSRARRFFLPTACGSGTHYRQDNRYGSKPATANPDNSTLLCLQRPEAEVYGIEWSTTADEYSVYESWKVTKAQLVEMVLTDEVEGIQRCCV